MSNWAKPGVKCVCVDNIIPIGPEVMQCLEAGKMYTIRAVEHFEGGMGITVNEIVNPSFMYNEGISEPVYRLDRFRPLITRTQEQDVALFKSLLNKVVAPVHA